jgi:hypothetical protein
MGTWIGYAARGAFAATVSGVVLVGALPAGVATASMATARSSFTATPLRDGRVLVVGGTSAEVYDSTSATWTPAGIDRWGFIGQPLPDGQVLVTGGTSEYGPPLASAEVYNPATARFTLTGSMHTARWRLTSAALRDGSILVAGGYDGRSELRSAERYLPATGRWTSASSMTTERLDAATALLPDGRVFVLSGGTYTTEIFDPASRIWRATATVFDFAPREIAVTLPDGRVLATGGAGGAVYSPATNQWTPTGPMVRTRYHAAAAPLPDGRVLYAGGYYTECDPTGEYCYDQDASDAEIYTP